MHQAEQIYSYKAHEFKAINNLTKQSSLIFCNSFYYYYHISVGGE